MEKWEPVRGFEGLYEVSTTGRLRSLPRVSIDGRRLKGRELALVHNSNDGYLRVNLRKRGAASVWLVHRLVADVFVPNPKSKPEVNHKNGDKTDNRAENLEWVTSRENQQHALRMGLRGLNDPAHSRRVGAYNPAGELCAVYPSAAEAHRATRISLNAIYNRCQGRSAGRLYGYEWRYL